MAISIGELIAKIKVDTGDFKAGLDLVREEVKKLDRAVGIAGRKLTVGLTLPIAALGAASVKASKDMDSLKRGMVAVTGSADRAAREMEKLKVVAQLPGLGFFDAVKGSTRLQAAGASAEQARRALQGFGNAIATVGGGKAELDGVTLALTQILASGKVLGQEVRQLQQRVPQIRQVMIAAFGTARSEEIQKLGITADEFLSKISTQLLNLPRVTGGVRNAFENLGDSMFRLGAAIGDGLLPVVIPLIESIAVSAEKMALLDKATIQWGIALATVAALLGPVLLGLQALATVAAATAAVLGLGLGAALLGAGGVIAALGLGTAAFIKWGLAAADARVETEKLVEEIEKIPGRILATGGFADEVARLFARMQDQLAGQRGAPGLGRPVAPLIDNAALAISIRMLATLRDRAADLVTKAEMLGLALRFEEDAEAAGKLQEQLALVRRELERVNQEILRQRLDPGGGGVTGAAPVGFGLPGVDRSAAGRRQFERFVANISGGLTNEFAETGDDLRDFGRLASRAAGSLGDFGGVLSGVIGGVAQGGAIGLGQAAITAIGAALSSLFKPDLVQANTEAIRRNTEAIQRSLRGVAGGQVAGIANAISVAIEAAFRAGDFATTLERELAKLNLTFADARALAETFGIELDGQIGTWSQLRDILQSKIFDDFVGKMDLARRRIALLDIEGPAAQFLEFQRALVSGLPGGISGLGTTVARLSTDTIDEFVRGVLSAIAAGTFDFGRLGGLSVDEFLTALGEMESLADAAEGAADELNGLTGALRNAPAGFKVALSRFNATTPVTSGTGGRGGITVDGDIIVVANDPDEMRRGIEDSVRRESRRGGVTSLDLSVRPVARAAGL